MIGKKEKKPPETAVKTAHKKAVFMGGAMASLLTAAVLAIVILVNLLMRALPSQYTQFDLSGSGLYTLTGTTMELLGGLQTDVTAYYLAQTGSEDENIVKLLDRYAGQSGHFTWTRRDPALYPTFAAQYGGENASDGSVILVSGQRSRVVDAADFYEYDYTDYYTTGSATTSFAAEEQLSAGLLYLETEDVPVVYQLSGHGENAVPANLANTIGNQSIKLQSASLLSVESVPEDADALLLLCPTVDYTAEDVQLLREYLAAGGKLLAVTDAQYSTPNLDTLLAEYGMSRTPGIVVEGDANHYMRSYPYYLIPDVAATEATEGLSGQSVLLPVAQGITLTETEGVTATALLTTSDAAYSKVAGYDMTTYDREEGDTDGAFTLAALVENDTSGAKLAWVNCAGIIDASVDEYVSGNNSKLLVNVLGAMLERENSGIIIDAKSMSAQGLTVPNMAVLCWGLGFLIVLPVALLIAGLVVTLVRRRK